MNREAQALWQVLDTGDVCIRELASALGKQIPVLSWQPHISNYGRFKNYERIEDLADPPLRVRHFPLQRGYSFAPASWVAMEGSRIAARFRKQTPDETRTPLICTSPHYAAVAARWRGPVIYYVIDFIPAYASQNPRRVRNFDRKLCEIATLVCPNSRRIADYLKREAYCPDDKIMLVPNATRAANLLPAPALEAAPLPEEARDLPRPIAGVIGNMAGNMNWEMMREVVARTSSWLSWLFVGPTSMNIEVSRAREARNALMKHGGRVHFTGGKPYGRLQEFARSFDVAVLPYTRREPTYSGSSTRFYQHLAACRPMITTNGVEELLHKEPLLKTVEDAAEMTVELERLRALNFRDGYEEMRWRTSQHETWEARATQMRNALKSMM